jgi:1,4-alpha-glucan branching enzyme
MAIPLNTAPTPYGGLGAVLQNGGCSYRVFAPFADQVSVGGDFFNAGNNDPTPGAWVEVPMQRDTSAYTGDYWSVFIPNVLADSLYKFHIINDGAQPNTLVQNGPTGGWKHDPYARDAVSFAGNSVVVDRNFDWTGDNFQMPAWNQLVIYELHIGSFNKDAGVVGTFAQATGKLGYLAALGINAIQILPAFDFDTTTSMGYNPGLPFAIDNAYGQTQALKQFIKAAHAVGIAVIMDVVYNHFGPQGLDEGLGQIDGWCLPGMRGIYFYNDVRIWTAYGNDRPDFGRGEVRQYISDNAMTILSEFHADGLRLDSTINIRRAIGGEGDNGPLPDGWSLLRWIGEEKRASQPWKILIAEDLQNDTTVTQDALFGGIGLDSQWDSWFVGRAQNNLLFVPNDDARSVPMIAEMIGLSYNNTGPFQRIIYAESHDQAYQQPRMPDHIAPGNADGWIARKLTTLAAGITFTSPGIPMIFMGQEFLEYRPWDDSAGATSLDWTRVTSCGGIVELYRRLIQLRRNWDNNTRGLTGSNTNVFHGNDDAGIIAYHRWDQGGPGDDVVVVVNIKGGSFQSYNIGFPQPGTWYLRFNSDWSGYWSDYSNIGYDTSAQYGANQNMPCNGNIGIGPYSVAIFSQ